MKHDANHAGHWLNMAKIAALGLSFVAASGLSFAQQAAPAAPAQHQDQYPELPAGAGKDTLVRVCSKCHSPDNVLANGQDRAGWEAEITKMAGFGAVGTDDEFTEILEYLVKNFPPGGPVNVNHATATQLKSGLGFSDTEAAAVIEYRKKNGDFKSIDDLKKVPELDAKKLDVQKAHLVF